MRVGLLAIAATSLGCALTQDFDEYSAKRGLADATAADTNVLADTSEPADTERPDTTTPPDDTGACKTGLELCSGSCFDTTTDREHCGGCTSCDAQGFKGASRCVAGKCECAAGASPCSGTCVYLDSDPLNCKSCGTAVVESNQVCSGGAVTCAPGLRLCDPWTPSGTTLDVECPRKCIDTGHDGDHCYEYSGSSITRWKRCYSSTSGTIGVCIAHDCVYRTSTSTSRPCSDIGRIECAVKGSLPDPDVRSCVDRMRDPNHCGSCDNACAKGELCAAGSCKAYRAARTSADCSASARFCTPPGWSTSVCIEGVSSCP